MRTYRMRVYRPGRPEPLLLQTHDIFAENDAAARALAWRRYDKLTKEFAQSAGERPISALRALSLNFSLSEGDRLVFENVRKDDPR
jgi:hypothetical protein